MSRPVVVLVSAALALAGCGKYADFSLPKPEAGTSAARFQWAVYPRAVIERGGAGEWDSSDALNPSIVHDGDTYYNFYSGFDGKTWHTGLATSPDGIAWTKIGRVLSPDAATWEGSYIAANGSALRDNGSFLYWYQAGDPPRVGFARSTDGRTWTKHPTPVLDVGPYASWDERGLGDPYVIRAAGQFYMFYTGIDRARRQRLGIARSNDGIVWRKQRSSPILELGASGAFDEIGLGEPAVWSQGGRYWMLYTGRDRREYRRIGLAVSDDGLSWQRSNTVPVLAGAQPWDDKVVCDPAVEVGPEGIRVWFGGGNVATPAERLNGQIGFALLQPAR